MKTNKYIVPPRTKIKLSDYPPEDTGPFKNKEEAAQKLETDITKLPELQARLYAQDNYALLIILQGIDAAGKDGTIKHVMSGVNPTGCQVTSFKSPSQEELDHDYLWRHIKALPARGMIGIFNRSYYEEVLVVRVHPELLAHEKLPRIPKPKELWEQRYREMNEFEHYLSDNGCEILKFFLHLSKDEQKRRFLKRLEAEDKNWKYSQADVQERAYWDDYQAAYEDMLNNTSTERAPWYVVPADHKWFTRVVVADAVVSKLEEMDPRYPTVDDERKKELAAARKLLESEK
jgi:PPK2 family polyphosphate:nucleotide phosphotransferase